MAQTSSAVRASGVSTEDRLSSLPDALLHTIMSFLKARQAVQTCVLSRRWVDLWCTMPCLDIDQRELDDTAPACLSLIDRETDETGRFVDFVHGLLMFYGGASLDTFKFHISRDYYDGIIDRCLCRGIKYCPGVLEICSAYGHDIHPTYELPHLGSGSCRLERMHIAGIRLDKSFTLHLRSGCPILEDLEIKRCHIAYPEFISCTLKNLTIEDCETYCGNMVTVTAPGLLSFRLFFLAIELRGILVTEMPALVKASICFHPDPCGLSSPEGSCRLLGSLINVSSLELSGSETLSILHHGWDSFPTFPNLRTLLFSGCDLSHSFQILAPNLERLTLQHCKVAYGSSKRKKGGHPKTMSLKGQNILTFECPDLKWTEIKYTEGNIQPLFDLLSGIWSNLQESTIMLTKA
ncbi:hypothetical protein ACP4OV_030505 [Aristida adscensionis]